MGELSLIISIIPFIYVAYPIVKAGLTGYAQVYGKYNTTPLDKLKLDLAYIESYSFWLDLKLILLTVKVLFQKEHTEGIHNWQTSAATEENLKKIGKK